MSSKAFAGMQTDHSIGSSYRHTTAPEAAGTLRILLLNYEFPPLGGGAGIACAALARQLAARGATVDVVTSRPTLAPTAAGSAGETLAPNLTLYRVRSRRRGVHQAGFVGAGTYLCAAAPVARRLLRTHRYDIVHIFFSLPTGALIPALPLGDIPLVVSLRGSDVPGYDERNPKLVLAHRVLRPLTRWIWNRASLVVPVCESLGILARKTLPELQYRVIGNGVDLELFAPGIESAPHDGAPVRCLAVGRLIERKGIADLLRAWTLLPRGAYALEIVGGGPQEPALRSLALELGLGNEVRFAGALPREQAAARYRDCDIFVLTPHEEAFGNVFAEAIAAGLPVVGSNVGAVPDLVQHGVNGILVPPGNSEAIARAVRTLGEDPAGRAAMAKRNRTDAESRLSWEAVTERYLALFEELINQREHARHGAAH